MGKTVVIVDDSAYQRKVIADILTNAGLNVVGEANNGEDAIDVVLNKNPDYVTMDNIMPGLNGVEASAAIKKEGCKTKILMISSVAQEMAIKNALENGVDEFLKKPYTSDDLIEAIQSL